MRNHAGNEIELFKNAWQNSSAAKLLIPINTAMQELENGFEFQKDSGFPASIAIMAFRNDCLSTLDSLMDRYDISQKGTKDFKNRLKKNWLEEDLEKHRDITNEVISSIAELAAAYYLEVKEGFTIKDLEAWNNDKLKPDISCCKNGEQFKFEVKLLPDSPEFYNLRLDAAKADGLDAAKADGVAVNSMSPHPVALNYYYFRLAEANIQLKKSKRNSDIPAIFFVFTESVHEFFIKEFLNSFGNRKEWYIEEKEEVPPGFPITTEKKELIPEALSKSPDEWFNETKILYIAKMKDFCLDCIYKS